MAETRDFPLDGWTVEQVAFDFQTRLLLYPPEPGSAPDCAVVLMGTFTLERPNEADVDLSAGPPFDGADLLLSLHRAAVSRFTADDEGRLRIEFVDGRAIAALRDPSYESWSVHGPVEMLCSPHPGAPWRG